MWGLVVLILPVTYREFITHTPCHEKFVECGICGIKWDRRSTTTNGCTKFAPFAAFITNVTAIACNCGGLLLENSGRNSSFILVVWMRGILREIVGKLTKVKSFRVFAVTIVGKKLNFMLRWSELHQSCVWNHFIFRSVLVSTWEEGIKNDIYEDGKRNLCRVTYSWLKIGCIRSVETE